MFLRAANGPCPSLDGGHAGHQRLYRNYGLWAFISYCFGSYWRTLGFVHGAFSREIRCGLAAQSAGFVGRLARGYNAARFASTLAMLAGAGVPILKALQAAAETLNNRALRADALDALVQVREGAPLASALAQKKLPSLLPMFARLGEQTGQLP